MTTSEPTGSRGAVDRTETETGPANSSVGQTGPLCRPVTTAELEFYRRNGWVKLENLISPELANRIMVTGKRIMNVSSTKRVKREDNQGGQAVDYGFYMDYHYAAIDDGVEPLRSLALAPEMGQNSQRFFGRRVPARFYVDILACKNPQGAPGSDATNWHQDYPGLPFDRQGSHIVWIALNSIPPERGSMRFLSGSHREGPLGREAVLSGVDMREEQNDILRSYDVSSPISLNPGDATVHSSLVVHSAPPNRTSEPRWSYILGYFPGDTLYDGAQHGRLNSLGLEINAPIQHPKTPIVFA